MTLFYGSQLFNINPIRCGVVNCMHDSIFPRYNSFLVSILLNAKQKTLIHIFTCFLKAIKCQEKNSVLLRNFRSSSDDKFTFNRKKLSVFKSDNSIWKTRDCTTKISTTVWLENNLNWCINTSKCLNCK